ncbi:MAG: START-like domain-containing protein [Crocinitomicaceae bacterium]|nr:START-like domain-containing protein [bacterium]MDG1742279.1 START-like domain-containing protein [Crocinitomicaceae bacterium]
MMEKQRFELEYLLKTSPKALDNMISTPSGLSEWFADDVNIKDDIYSFIWDGSEEEARLITKKPNSKVKWKWLEDEEDEIDAFFELRFEVDPMTKVVILSITDFAEDDEVDEAKRLWDQQISELKRVLGA